MSDKAEKVEFWGLVEIFGHQQLAGHIAEAQIGGCAFVRVDVPECGMRPAWTRFFGNGAIYSMTPTSEEIARAAAERLAKNGGSPLPVYVPELEAAHQVIRQAEQIREQQKALPAGTFTEDGERFEDDDYDEAPF